MATRAGDAFTNFISDRPPSPPRSAFLDTQGRAERQQERQRSSSFGDAPPQRSSARIALGLLPNPRRRSSGGNSFVQGGTASQTKVVLPAFGLRDSARPGTRAVSPPAPSPAPQLRTLDSYNARNVAAALDQGGDPRQIDDVWQQVCVRILPLFNGEGIRGFVEDLNALVLTHVQRRFALTQSVRQRAQPNPSVDGASLVTGLVIADLTDLIRMGLTTLAHKLAPPAPASALGDDRLLARLNEIWLFFFTGILPHLEAVFWVLRSDERLRAAVGRAPQPGRHREEGRIDVRRIALIEFRDQILHPEMDRLVQLLSHVYLGGGDAGGAVDGRGSRPGSRHPSFSAERPPAPPDVRRARSHLHATFQAASLAHETIEHPHPHRQFSSPPRLSPDPAYIASFPSPIPSASATLPPPPLSVPPTPGGPSPATAQAYARRRQMVAVLAALRTDDDRQGEMDALLHLIRPAPLARGQPPRQTASAPRPAPQAGGTGYSTPAGLSSGDDGAGSGVVTGLTGSPLPMTDELSSLSSRGHGDDNGEPPAVPPPPPQVATPEPALAPFLPHAIDARQRHRSRTMDSFDEEAATVQQHPTRTLRALAPPRPRPPHLSRASSDGGAHASGYGDEEAKKMQPPAAPPTAPPRRLSLFLPHFKRSNSAASTATAASAASAPPDATVPGIAIEDDAGAGAAGGGGGGGGERFRRGLLRRNSLRRATDVGSGLPTGVGAGGAVPALGVASGFAVEDDALDEWVGSAELGRTERVHI
ncbi:hypothetical protein JCM3770_003458 [Rhodotorula araucariae]